MAFLSREIKNSVYKLKKPSSVFLNNIVCGDCTEVLKTLPENLKFDVVIADPPYNIGKSFGNNKTCLSLKNYTLWALEWITLCLQRLKTGGLLYIYGFSEILAHLAVQFPLENQKWLARID